MVPIEGAVQNFWGKVPLGTHFVVVGQVDCVDVRVVLHAEAEVGDSAREVLLHQNVFGFQIPMSNWGFAYHIKLIFVIK